MRNMCSSTKFLALQEITIISHTKQLRRLWENCGGCVFAKRDWLEVYGTSNRHTIRVPQQVASGDLYLILPVVS
jgi:hypothetical protein